MEFQYDEEASEHLTALDKDRAFTSSSSLLCSVIHQCRICHEEEPSETCVMETPCACSGTLKFAHRGCIQRWCDEKGSTLCEICLQNFEPTYTVAPKKGLIDMGVTIRGSLEVPRVDYESQMISFSDPETVPVDFNQCSPALRRKASYCRSMALTVPDIDFVA
ncbi:hypothetical protein ZOSMA_41G00120 [Zostera marina]|uniref:RING-CH-type domain-containing protein n=1 Tax=Zostera marina TaxID=29655 RepID=A0A0K9P4S5_ZOSMR|nr:hypothetical protein ZOSMA_41G00120 [Zostera marina]